MKPVLLYLLMISSSLLAQKPDSTSALSKLYEAEQNFAKYSVTHGRKTAFIEFLAENSVIFTGKWLTNGKGYWKNRPAPPVVLKWEPEYINISDSHDFGISTGPWEAQEYRPNTRPVSTGYYLSVWKREKNSDWKVILDAGSESPPPRSDFVHRFYFPAGDDKASINVKNNSKPVSDELSDMDNQISKAWKNNPVVSTYRTFLTGNTRMQRNHHLPSDIPDTINIWISELEKTITWVTKGEEIASSGELGFTYGIVEDSSFPDKIKGHYVRIWERESSFSWKIIIEMMNIE